MCERGGNGGGGVSLGDGDLLSLTGLLSTVGTEALTFQHRGTSTMETVRDAEVWLALHEGPLHNEEQKVSVSKTQRSSLTLFTSINQVTVRSSGRRGRVTVS